MRPFGTAHRSARRGFPWRFGPAIRRGPRSVFGVDGDLVVAGRFDGDRFVVEALGEDAPRDDAPRDEAPRDEASRDEASRDEASREDANRGSGIDVGAAARVAAILPATGLDAAVFDLPGVPAREVSDACALAWLRTSREALAREALAREGGRVERDAGPAIGASAPASSAATALETLSRGASCVVRAGYDGPERHAWIRASIEAVETSAERGAARALASAARRSGASADAATRARTIGDARAVPEFEALGRVLPEEGAEEGRPVAVLHVAERTSTLLFYRGGRLRTRHVTTCGVADWAHAMTEPIRSGDGRELRLDLSTARRVLAEHRIDVDAPVSIGDERVSSDRLFSLARPSLERLVRDVTRWTRHFQITTLESRPRRLLLAGEGAGVAGLGAFLQRYVRMPVEPLDPLGSSAVRFGSEVEAALADPLDRARYAAAIGAARVPSHEGSIVPPSRRRREAATLVRRIVRYAACAAFALALLVAWAGRAGRGEVRARVAEARAALGETVELLEILSEGDLLESRADDSESRLRSLRPRDVRWSLVLRDVAAGLADNAWIEHWHTTLPAPRADGETAEGAPLGPTDPGVGALEVRVAVRGTRAAIRDALARFAARLDDSPQVTRISLRRESSDPTTGIVRVRFVAEVRVPRAAGTGGSR